MSGITINSNTVALRAQRKLDQTSQALGHTLERLSSGMRINRAADDAAGLSISESLRADGRVFGQAIRNVNDGISALAIAEGALAALTDISIRQRELATQAANGTYTTSQRRALTDEASALTSEFNRIVNTTKFNGRNLLSDPEEFRIQAGYGTAGSIGFSIGSELSRVAGDGTFSSGGAFTALGGADANGLGDFNGDGKIDIVTGVSVVNRLGISFGNGDGTFGAVASFAGYGFAYNIISADLNNDGKMDIAVSGTGGLTLRLGNGNGTFRTAKTYAIGGGTYGMTVNDFNGDGILDAAAAGVNNMVCVSYGRGDGTMTLGVTMAMTGSFFTSAGDFNGDSRTDLVVASDSQVFIFENTGTSFSRTPQSSMAIPATVRGVSAGDLNGDGYSDLVVGALDNDGGGPNTSGSFVYLGKGDGSFQPKQALFADVLSNKPGIFDLNGDGRLDLVLPTNDGVPVRVALGNGNGTFGARIGYPPSTGNHRDPVAADLNSDGALDFVIQRLGTVFDVYLGHAVRTSSIEYMNLNTAENARDALAGIDETINRIGEERGVIGSIQSRLAVAAANLTSMRENGEAAAGRIRDADIAEESAALTRTTILQQVGASVLGQANQQPAIALRLLGL